MRADHAMRQLAAFDQPHDPRPGDVEEVRRFLGCELGVVGNDSNRLSGGEMCHNVEKKLHGWRREYECLRLFSAGQRHSFDAHCPPSG